VQNETLNYSSKPISWKTVQVLLLSVQLFHKVLLQKTNRPIYPIKGSHGKSASISSKLIADTPHGAAFPLVTLDTLALFRQHSKSLIVL
jgi:hypothetical protein